MKNIHIVARAEYRNGGRYIAEHKGETGIGHSAREAVVNLARVICPSGACVRPLTAQSRDLSSDWEITPNGECYK